MIVSRYENGNMTVKAEPEDITGCEGLLIYLVWALGDKDAYLFGEEYCISNWDMAIDFYSAYTGLLYRFCYASLEDLKAGKTVRLYGRKMTNDERDEYEELLKKGEI